MSTYSEDKIGNAIYSLNKALQEFRRGSYSDEIYYLNKATLQIQDAIELSMKEQLWQTERS